MKFLLPLLMLASVGAPPAPESTRDDDRGPPDPAPPEPVPSRSEPSPPPDPVLPLANVPDATLRRRARKGDREAVAELARRAAMWPGGQPPDAIDRVKRVRAMGSVNPETGAHHRGLAETLAALRASCWDVEAADRAMRGAP